MMQKVLNSTVLKNNIFHQFLTMFGVAFHHPSSFTVLEFTPIYMLGWAQVRWKSRMNDDCTNVQRLST